MTWCVGRADGSEVRAAVSLQLLLCCVVLGGLTLNREG